MLGNLKILGIRTGKCLNSQTSGWLELLCRVTVPGTHLAVLGTQKPCDVCTQQVTDFILALFPCWEK